MEKRMKNEPASCISTTIVAGMVSVMSAVMLLTSPSRRLVRSPVWCFCRCIQSQRNRRVNIFSLILFLTLLPTTECIQRLMARDMISVSMSAPIITPVTASEPSVTPVAMSMACLQARTHINWHTTSRIPIAVFVTACLRAPLEFFHSHIRSLLEDICLSVSTIFLNILLNCKYIKTS